MKKSVPLVCYFLFIGVLICQTNANDDNVNDINGIEEYRTVETKSGKIRGNRKLSSLNDIPYYSFKGSFKHPLSLKPCKLYYFDFELLSGIRYAKPPIGALRFKVSKCV